MSLPDGYYLVMSPLLNKLMIANSDYNVSFESQTTSTLFIWYVSTDKGKTTFKS